MCVCVWFLVLHTHHSYFHSSNIFVIPFLEELHLFWHSQGYRGNIGPRLHTWFKWLKVKVTLLLTVNHSASQVNLDVEPHLELVTIYVLLFDSWVFFVEHPLLREDVAVFCICCWPLPAQFFSCPCTLGLSTILYTLRFESSFYVASYDSQARGGGIRLCLHTIMTASIWLTCKLFADPLHRQGLHNTVVYSPVA
jgi:hypothetical protein